MLADLGFGSGVQSFRFRASGLRVLELGLGISRCSSRRWLLAYVPFAHDTDLMSELNGLPILRNTSAGSRGSSSCSPSPPDNLVFLCSADSFPY